MKASKAASVNIKDGKEQLSDEEISDEELSEEELSDEADEHTPSATV
jgi:hypothetical protein